MLAVLILLVTTANTPENGAVAETNGLIILWQIFLIEIVSPSELHDLRLSVTSPHIQAAPSALPSLGEGHECTDGA